jgi:C_GCAxxG_C_C family probable redox protein
MEKYEQAAALFHEGFRCSQAVLEVFAEELGIDPDIARKVSLGLAAGSGAGGECGAVAAAYLVNGLKNGFSHPGDPEKFKTVMMKNVQFLENFKALHGKINCQDLISLDLFTEEGKKYFQENDIKTKICTKFVEDSVKILEKIG